METKQKQANRTAIVEKIVPVDAESRSPQTITVRYPALTFRNRGLFLFVNFRTLCNSILYKNNIRDDIHRTDTK